MRLRASTVGLALTSVALPHPAAAQVDFGTDPLRHLQWSLGVIHAPRAWQTATGEGVTIAIVDTGVDLEHEDLEGKIVRGWDFVDDDRVAQDEHGHGTHAAGIAAAETGNGRGIAGVAPEARIMPIRVLDENGSGTSADVAAGIRWAVNHGADIVNISLGEFGVPLFAAGIRPVLRRAWSEGVIVVVSAGKVEESGYDGVHAVVVAATDRRDRRSPFSSDVGSARWALAAPGGGGEGAPKEQNVLSTHWIGAGADRYAYLSGTSMAAPHVAGAAALLRSLGLTPRETIRQLLNGAADVGLQGPDARFGAGRLDVARAVESAGVEPEPTTGGPTLVPPLDASSITVAPPEGFPLIPVAIGCLGLGIAVMLARRGVREHSRSGKRVGPGSRANNGHQA